MAEEKFDKKASEGTGKADAAPSRKEMKDKRQKQIEELQQQNEELKKLSDGLGDKLAAEKSDYLKLMAEFETFRRRSAEDRLKLVASASADTVKGMLPVLDDCERAIEMMGKSGDSAALEGTKLIYDKLMEYLKSKGLEIIDCVGKDFDTDFHEAVMQTPAPDKESAGKVLTVVQTGYLFGGKVLRFAKVIVGQ